MAWFSTLNLIDYVKCCVFCWSNLKDGLLATAFPANTNLMSFNYRIAEYSPTMLTFYFYLG